ncbi:unnamed protein product [Owenia fusiformis]|uniref:Innexin n=1 Tax=Owenia fusiformis TaxID=6347 RepID=A0A8J1TWB5_OWEFU|nr:unnamed protein product [Owenia fusiformis]
MSFFGALDILSSGGDGETFVTDFSSFKIVYLLTVYLPVLMGAFLWSQEHLGAKIACFPNIALGDNQNKALNSHCWSEGFYVTDPTDITKSLKTQPHRFFAIYLGVQAVVFIVPVLVWNTLTKATLLGILAATKTFLSDLADLLIDGSDAEDVREAGIAMVKIRMRIAQYYESTMEFAYNSKIAIKFIGRLLLEMALLVTFIVIQLFVYDSSSEKRFYCVLPGNYTNQVHCTLPMLDMLDNVWYANVIALGIALLINIVFICGAIKKLCQRSTPDIFMELPFDVDYPSNSVWKTSQANLSYKLMSSLFWENNPITTQLFMVQSLSANEQLSENLMKMNIQESSA